MLKESIEKLSAKMPEAAIQRTRKADTRKGYDTDGYGYQYVVDRLNEELGADWGFMWDVVDHAKGAYKSGAPYHEVTVRVEIWIGEAKPRSCVGGHTSTTFADALKGAITNGFKKTAAFWGVGREAYAGTIDDDNVLLPVEHKNKVKLSKEVMSEVYQSAKKLIEDCNSFALIGKVAVQIAGMVKDLPEAKRDDLRRLYEKKRETLIQKERVIT